MPFRFVTDKDELKGDMTKLTPRAATQKFHAMIQPPQMMRRTLDELLADPHVIALSEAKANAVQELIDFLELHKTVPDDQLFQPDEDDVAESDVHDQLSELLSNLATEVGHPPDLYRFAAKAKAIWPGPMR